MNAFLDLEVQLGIVNKICFFFLVIDIIKEIGDFETGALIICTSRWSSF